MIMSMKGLSVAIAVAALSAVCVAQEASTEQPAPPAPSQILEGNEGSACSMLLCLSNPAGKGLAECTAPLKKYFGMRPDKRPGFLSKCPLVGGK